MSDAPAPGNRLPGGDVQSSSAFSQAARVALLRRIIAAGWIGLALAGATAPWVVIALEVVAPGWLLR